MSARGWSGRARDEPYQVAIGAAASGWSFWNSYRAAIPWKIARSQLLRGAQTSEPHRRTARDWLGSPI